MAEVVFPEHVRERMRQIAASAPPLTPEQKAIIRTCFTKPKPARARGEDRPAA